MKRAILAAACIPALAGCAALGAWLDAPASEPIGIHDENTGAGVGVTLPEGEPMEPITVGDENTGAVTITPPGGEPQTRGDAIARSAGQIAGTLTGNPLLGLLVGGAATALLGRRKA